MLETSGDVRENDSSPAEVEQLPDAIPAQGDAVNDGEMYSTNPGSRSDLVSDSDIGLVPESTSCSSAAASVGDKMDIDMESLEQNIDFGHKRAQSLSPNSLNPTPQKRALPNADRSYWTCPEPLERRPYTRHRSGGSPV